MREDPIIEPNNEYDREFKPFCGMQGEQRWRVLILAEGILIRYERDLLEKCCEIELAHVVCYSAKLLQVLPTFIALIGTVIQVLSIVNVANNHIHQIEQSNALLFPQPAVERLCKIQQGRTRAPFPV